MKIVTVGTFALLSGGNPFAGAPPGLPVTCGWLLMRPRTERSWFGSMGRALAWGLQFSTAAAFTASGSRCASFASRWMISFILTSFVPPQLLMALMLSSYPTQSRCDVQTTV